MEFVKKLATMYYQTWDVCLTPYGYLVNSKIGRAATTTSYGTFFYCVVDFVRNYFGFRTEIVRVQAGFSHLIRRLEIIT